MSFIFQWSVTGESVGTGNGSTVTFTHTAKYLPLVANTSSGQVTIYNNGTLVGTDNGSGTVTGTGLTGTVNYTTGAISVTFTTAPANTNPITVNYAVATINIPISVMTTNDFGLFTIKQLLKQAGWTVVNSGDGTTYYSTSDGITVQGTGSHGMSNTYAWFVIKDPASTHYYCFQRGTSAGLMSVCVSKVGFTGTANGSPSGTIAPTASDQYGVFGTLGQTTSIAYADWYSSQAVTSYHFNCGADNASPYGMWASTFPKNTNTYNSAVNGMLIDGMTSGSYNSGDTDPWCIFVGNSTSYWCNTNGTTNQCVSSQGPSGTLTNYLNYVDWPLSTASGTGTTNLFTGKDDCLPIMWYFTSSSNGAGNLKGQGYYYYWDTFNNRNTATTLDVSAISDHIVINCFVFPWLSGASVLVG